MSIIKGTNQIVAGFGGTKRSIGEVYFSQSALATDNSGALPLFTGETITSANTIYPEFYNWVLAHTELQCTSEEYESALSTYGECAKYVISDGSLRLPLIKNYIKAANPSEGIKNIEAGLPNIEGEFKDEYTILKKDNSANSGAIKSVYSQNPGKYGYSIAGSEWGYGFVFDASNSNPIYGKSSTVTPASTTLYPWVVVYTAAIPASTAQAAQFQQGLSGKADTNLGNVPSNYDYVVESQVNADGSWYRKYKSGWLEQGGGYGESFVEYRNVTITLLKPFRDTKYTLLHSNSSSGDSYEGVTMAKTVSTFSMFNATNKDGLASWEAKGMGAN